MSAWAEIQQNWACKTEKGLVTGVLLWDLSTAFDTLDSCVLCSKLELYGFNKVSVSCFRSYMTGRSQRVKINSTISNKKSLITGVPKRGVLSPLVFILYMSDLEDWLKQSEATTYADDTGTISSGQNIEEVVPKLENDAEEVLKFMVSNGLIANTSKTTLVILNNKTNKIFPAQIKIGKTTILQEKTAKLLGMTFDEKLEWNTNINEKRGTHIIPEQQAVDGKKTDEPFEPQCPYENC
jgi:hypothetical protein